MASAAAINLLRDLRPDPDAPSAAPADAHSAAVQAAAAAAERLPEAAIAVQRLLPSRPRDAAASLHDKDAATTANLRGAERGGAIDVAPLRDEGWRSLQVWDAMHANPALLDSREALERSAPARAALAVLALAQGGAPPLGTVMLAGAGSSSGGGGSSGSGGGGGAAPAASAEAAASSALAAAGALERVTALAASGEGGGLHGLLLAAPRRSGAELGVAAWPPPPPQNSPYDQLLLGEGEEPLRLTRGQVFELFARRRADAGYWSAARLAAHYGTREEWVAALLEVAAPPVFAHVDGEQYGVFAIRPVADLK